MTHEEKLNKAAEEEIKNAYPGDSYYYVGRAGIRLFKEGFKAGAEFGRKIERTRIGAQIKEEELTWEDVKRIVEIADGLLPYASVKLADLEHEFQTEEMYYKKVLKMYNDGK